MNVSRVMACHVVSVTCRVVWSCECHVVRCHFKHKRNADSREVVSSALVRPFFVFFPCCCCCAKPVYFWMFFFSIFFPFWIFFLCFWNRFFLFGIVLSAFSSSFIIIVSIRVVVTDSQGNLVNLITQSKMVELLAHACTPESPVPLVNALKKVREE